MAVDLYKNARRRKWFSVDWRMARRFLRLRPEVQEVPTFPFQVEVVDPAGRFVLCRELQRNRFRLGPGAQLQGAGVRAVTQPRALDAQGEPRLDLYLFRLEHPADARRFKVGETVTLSADDAPRVLIPS